MLLQAAANQFKVGMRQVTAANGVVTVTGTSQKATYGQLAPAAALLTPPANPPLVSDASFRIIGKPVQRLDIPSKVDGSAIYGIDVRVPGMLHAVIVNCPVAGGTVSGGVQVPAGAIAAVPVPLTKPNAVAVVASNTWAAMQAAQNLNVNWNIPAALQLSSAQIMAQAKTLMASGKPAVAETAGNALSTIAASKNVVSATYSFPYLAHACMEVLCCTASVTKTGCEVWAPTQAPDAVQAAAAAITGFPLAKVIVHPTFMGGGLGRKFEVDYIAQAVSLAKVLGKPVKLTWPREEDFSHDLYRPMSLNAVTASLDTKGNITAWHNRIVQPSIIGQNFGPGALQNGVDSQAVEGAIGLTYGFGSRLVEYVIHPATIPVGFWRSVGNSINIFVVESMIDELALAAGKDSYQFRRTLLANDPQALAVLDAAAKLGGWGTALPAGRQRGIAIARCFGSIVAQVAEVSVPNATSVKVHSVACAVDSGLVVNPDTAEAQIQGGIAHGLTAMMWGHIPFSDGQANTSNFDSYRMTRISEMPVVSLKLMPSGGFIGGMGEIGVPCIAPAVVNAHAALTGKRVRDLPMFPAQSFMGEGGG
jgi:isoquinoline 1-oxidoreductase beta subunit